MPAIEISETDQSALFRNHEFGRSSDVDEIQLLIHSFVCGLLDEKIRTANHVLVIGPGFHFPEFDLFSRLAPTEGNTVIVETITALQQLVSVEREPLYTANPLGIYRVISQLPVCEIHQPETISHYYATHQSANFDLILYLRTEMLRAGHRPDNLSQYLSTLLLPHGLAVVTGDKSGIDRLITAPSKDLYVVVQKDNLPEGVYQGVFAKGHSGVVLAKSKT